MRDEKTVLQELIATGLGPVQQVLLLELVRIMSTGLSTGQGGESPTLLKRRAWDRDRKQREREALKLSTMSTGHPPDSTGNKVEKAEVCLDEEEKNRSLQEVVKKESKKGSRLLIGALINDENRAVAIECGCPPDKVDAVWTEFVDYWSDIPGRFGCRLSWTGTWRNRVKALFKGSKNGNAAGNHRTVSATGRATAREADQIAAMGRGAANRLAMRAPAGPDNGETPGSAGSAEVFDIRKRAETAY